MMPSTLAEATGTRAAGDLAKSVEVEEVGLRMFKSVRFRGSGFMDLGFGVLACDV